MPAVPHICLTQFQELGSPDHLVLQEVVRSSRVELQLGARPLLGGTPGAGRGSRCSGSLQVLASNYSFLGNHYVGGAVPMGGDQ
jgi:hypothetical protein